MSELEYKMRRTLQFESESLNNKVKDLENKLKEREQEFESQSGIIQHKVEELKEMLKAKKQNAEECVLLRQKSRTARTIYDVFCRFQTSLVRLPHGGFMYVEFLGKTSILTRKVVVRITNIRMGIVPKPQPRSLVKNRNLVTEKRRLKKRSYPSTETELKKGEKIRI